jgi:hypothetical protein
LPDLTSRLLGPLDPSETFWGEQADVQLAGEAVRVWYFVHGAAGQAVLDDAERMLDHLDALDAAARRAIGAQLAEEGSTVAEFKEFHVEDIGDMAHTLFNTTNLDDVTSEVFMASLVLNAVAVTPGSASRAISLDYAVGAGKPTDQVLMVSFSPAGEVTDIAHES